MNRNSNKVLEDCCVQKICRKSYTILWPPSTFQYITNNGISQPSEAFSNSLHTLLSRDTTFFLHTLHKISFFSPFWSVPIQAQVWNSKPSLCFITILRVWNSQVLEHLSVLDHVDYLKFPIYQYSLTSLIYLLEHYHEKYEHMTSHRL